MEPLVLLSLLGALLGGLVLKTIEHYYYRVKEANRFIDEVMPPPGIILPSTIQKTEDFVWFETVMKMAGMENVPVINTCDCGYATECYMHCNHDLKNMCSGPAYVPWTGKFEPVKRSPKEVVESEHRPRTVSDKDIDAFKQKMIDKRNAKLKAEAAPDKVYAAAKAEIENLRKRIDEREIKLRKIEARLDRLNKNVTPPKPMYITQPTTYDPVLDCYTVYGKKISRHMLEDLMYNGYLTREQLKEIIAPEAEYETVMLGDGTCYDIRVR